ncbi:MAG: FAD-dependent oxidoreductase [Eubacteriales bacterium]
MGGEYYFLYRGAAGHPCRGGIRGHCRGLRPSGIAAAVAAARGGARVLLVEYFGCVGGISTTGLMSHFTGRVNSGMYDEILSRSAAVNDGEAKGKITPTINPEKLKNVYLDMLTQAGVDILLYTLVCDAIVEDGAVKGIITESKSGRRAYLSKVVVDATGDGDVAARAGAEYYLGREDGGAMQPATIMFKVGGVDMARAVYLSGFEDTYQTPKGELQALARQHLPHPAGHVLLYRSTLPGIVTCNMTNVTGIDGTKAEDLTRGELVCRSQLEPIVSFLREFVPGYEECYIISAASMLGIRETRHFKGMTTLTEHDILEARVFEDWVVRDAHFNFDVHNLTGAGLDKTGAQRKFGQSKGYTIPYGCLVPDKLDGLLLSGRNISGTHMAHSNFRVMPICVGIGQAGGVAASLAVKKGIKVRDVQACDIQKVLLEGKG